MSTDLLKVRETAEYINGSTYKWEKLDEWRKQLCSLATYALNTIDPEPDAAITSAWLREEWGFDEIFDSEEPDYIYYDIHGTEVAKVYQYGDVWTMEVPAWPHDLHTRQQFCDLVRALNIQRKDANP